MSSHCNQSVETQYIGELPVDTLASIPDFFLAERDVLDEPTGNVIRSIVRVPAGKLFPNANMDNITAIEANNPALTIPERQVRAVYIKNLGSSAILDYASTSHPPVYLALSKLTEDLVLCQNTGTINIPEGHDYILGTQYYLGEDGAPVTDATSGIKLFVPVSKTQLAVKM